MRYLRIKRVYFDRILSGKKKSEYRARKAYYSFLEAKNLKKLRFHFQTDEYIEVNVKKIRVIKTPKNLNPEIEWGDEVYKIDFERPVLKRKRR